MISITNNLKRYKLGFIATLLLILSACSILPKSEPLAVYRINVPAKKQTTNTLSVIDESLKISTPYSGNFINSNRVLVRTSTGQINAYQGARWSDSVPTMFRDYLIEYFRDNGKMESVINDSFTISSTYSLEIDLRRFESVYVDNVFFVDIDFDAILVNNRTHKTIGVKNFKDKKQVNGTDIVSIVEQFNNSSQTVANDLLLWANEQITKFRTK